MGNRINDYMEEYNPKLDKIVKIQKVKSKKCEEYLLKEWNIIPIDNNTNNDKNIYYNFIPYLYYYKLECENNYELKLVDFDLIYRALLSYYFKITNYLNDNNSGLFYTLFLKKKIKLFSIKPDKFGIYYIISSDIENYELNNK